MENGADFSGNLCVKVVKIGVNSAPDFIRHVAVIPSFHRKQVTGREGMIGEECKVVKPLTPVGLITIKGEYWSAKSADDSIEADENVEIVGLEGLTLMVKRKGR